MMTNESKTENNMNIHDKKTLYDTLLYLLFKSN